MILDMSKLRAILELISVSETEDEIRSEREVELCYFNAHIPQGQQRAFS